MGVVVLAFAESRFSGIWISRVQTEKRRRLNTHTKKKEYPNGSARRHSQKPDDARDAIASAAFVRVSTRLRGSAAIARAMSRPGGVSRSRPANEGERDPKRPRIGGAPQNVETEVRRARVLNDHTVCSVRAHVFYWSNPTHPPRFTLPFPCAPDADPRPPRPAPDFAG